MHEVQHNLCTACTTVNFFVDFAQNTLSCLYFVDNKFSFVSNYTALNFFSICFLSFRANPAGRPCSERWTTECVLREPLRALHAARGPRHFLWHSGPPPKRHETASASFPRNPQSLVVGGVCVVRLVPCLRLKTLSESVPCRGAESSRKRPPQPQHPFWGLRCGTLTCVRLLC